MSKKLAIKGHPTRGKEVIELLEMMGGKNSAACGDNEKLYYFIGVNNIIDADDLEYNGVIIFTLEEFLKKYPFEVGDKVVYTKFGDNCNDYPVTIESMKWTGTTIEYTFNDCVTCLTKDLKMWEEDPKAVISGICLNSCDYADEVELNLGDYEIEVRDGRTFAVKRKPKYPDNYEECVRIAKNIHGYDIHIDAPTYGELMESFVKLLICRDAYWKIAGEQMGLDKPWEPVYIALEDNTYFTVQTFNGEIDKSATSHRNAILAFPTIEMRDAFYENFKDLIEQCKELL